MDSFLQLAYKGGHLSDGQFKRLADAFYGTNPTVEMHRRARQGGKKVAEEQHDWGWAGYSQRGSTSSCNRVVESFPADVREVTVILEPAPDLAEKNMSVEEIWGKPIVIERVPLDR
ncbi:MAG: hypothetical protein ACUVXJ_02425 [Phycisphaerae bacterium]